MDPRVSFVTLGVADLAASRAFYVDGLGWPVAFEDDHEVLMIQVGPTLVLSLWDRAAFEAEAGSVGEPGAPVPLTLAHNCVDRAAVDDALAAAQAAGARLLGPAQERVWGGYTGYFADPDGFRWEVAWNPGPIGQLVLPEVDPTG